MILFLLFLNAFVFGYIYKLEYKEINSGCYLNGEDEVTVEYGNKYNEDRAISIYSKLFKHPHRHVVWTIPKELRRFFREDRSRLNYIFEAASITIKYWFKIKYKKKNLLYFDSFTFNKFGVFNFV